MLPAVVKADWPGISGRPGAARAPPTVRGGWVERGRRSGGRSDRGREWDGDGSPPRHASMWTGHPPASPAPPARVRSPARREGAVCRAGSRSEPPRTTCATPSHPPARGRVRHPHRSRAPRAQGCQHHTDLHPRAQPGAGGSAQPRGPPLQCVRLPCPAGCRDRPTGYTATWVAENRSPGDLCQACK